MAGGMYHGQSWTWRTGFAYALFSLDVLELDDIGWTTKVT